jgi:AcrR family transcriptional regulator
VTNARKSRADGDRTREAIVREAVSLATLDGLEGLSIGNLADALAMSKSGVYAHFGSKQELQLATLDEAAKIFADEVIEPALVAEPPGLAQLVALCDAFFDHLLRRTLPGGCFWCGVVVEMGTRPGPVKDQITAFQGALIALMRDLIGTAIERGDISDDEDPDALAFELSGVMFAANANFVLRDDAGAVAMARGIVHRRLGTPAATK